MSSIQEVNSLEEASAVISNLRKMSSNRSRHQGLTLDESLMRGIHDFDRLVNSSCTHVRKEADAHKKIDKALCKSPTAAPSVDFRSDLQSRIYNSPIRERIINKTGEDDDEWSVDSRENSHSPPRIPLDSLLIFQGADDSDEEKGFENDFDKSFYDKNNSRDEQKINNSMKKKNSVTVKSEPSIKSLKGSSFDAEFTYDDDDDFGFRFVVVDLVSL